ncbi:ankyrin [Lophium mytilinum]|uniref:Ankyrin n=1 Tax=Lophium mytilinum TaxID=390894 RepID=A0A6A6QVG4_9PEZI|nr:ankyrin [Lophium mytilinum]
MEYSDQIDVNAQTMDTRNRQELEYLAFEQRESMFRPEPCGAKVRTVSGRTALHEAARAGNVHPLKRLLASPKIIVDSPDLNGLTALHNASIYGHLDAMKLLLEAGVDPNQKVSLPYEKPAVSDLERTTYMWTALHFASAYVKDSVRSYANLYNMLVDLGDTLLHSAAASGKSESVLLLLQQPSVDINAQNAMGFTALHSRIRQNEKLCQLVAAPRKDHS